ncbi:MAG: DUF1667 domain-containing protein [Ruminococcaceae bacterium]|nr:DUF1667 domain-containing protein [Oscillospiraceae bacterium]
MATKEMTCIVCPQGCRLKVEYDGGEIISVSGFTCKRGEKYAVKEITAPERTITSTVAAYNSEDEIVLLPVKSDKPIPKGKMNEAMKIINSCKVKLPIKTGTVIVSNFIENGINLVSCKTLTE